MGASAACRSSLVPANIRPLPHSNPQLSPGVARRLSLQFRMSRLFRRCFVISAALVVASMSSAIDANRFYHLTESYHGHDVAVLSVLVDAIRASSNGVIFLAGDSTLDNKFWIRGAERNVNAIGAYSLLSPPWMVADIAYHLTHAALDHNMQAINAAVEESTISDRDDRLLPQDRFIVDQIRAQDVLVVSVGGNDVALRSTLSTKFNMFKLVNWNSVSALRDSPQTCWGINHFVDMFGRRLQQYVERLVAQTRPKIIVICMVYYPDESAEKPGWANQILSWLKYDREPERLQAAIKAIYELAVCRIKIDGTRVIPLALGELLDPKDTRDYVERVEPSGQGGKKMATGIFKAIVTDDCIALEI